VIRRIRGRAWTIIGVIALAGVALAAVRLRGSERAAPSAGVGVARATKHHRNGVGLPAAAERDNAIDVVKAKRAMLAGDLSVVGSVVVDQNQFAIVGPLVSGRVTKVVANVGKLVHAGDVLAEIDSPDVGQARAAYLSASARFTAAEANLKRERELAQQHVSSERERELAEAQAISEAAELRAASERLQAFGVRPDEAKQQSHVVGGRVALRAPISGTVVARHVTLGQAVERATDAFKIVNLRKLWVLLDLYEKDLSRVHVGQKVELRTEALPGQVLAARIAYVSPIVDDKTRTADVRIEYDNHDGKLRPGQFVTARLIGQAPSAARQVLAVPRRTVQTVDGKPVVFVHQPGSDRFVQRHVEIGATAGDLVEIRSGIHEGDEVAAEGAFLLKSELLR
jgi:cobalt-zinc-cadmium efflux system membrane fusion protein